MTPKMAPVMKAGRKVRRAAATGSRAVLAFGAIVFGFLATVFVISLLFAAIDGLAVALGIPAFLLYMLLLLILWAANKQANPWAQAQCAE